MKQLTRGSLVLVCAVTLVLAGCTEQTLEPSSVDQSPEAQAPPAQQPQPSPTPAPSERRESAPPAGYAILSVAQPTGDVTDSIVHIRKTAPKEVIVGQEFDYRITVTNLTKEILEDVILTAKLPSGFAPSRSSPEAKITDTEAVWRIGRLEPKAVKTLLLFGTATRTGSLTFCSDIAYKISQDCLAIRAVQPALKVTKSGPSDVILCDAIPYKLTVSNPGSGSTHNVRVVEALPNGMKTLDGKTNVVFSASTLAPGQSREVTVQVKAHKAGTYVNTVTATADGGLSAKATIETVVRQPLLAVNLAGPERRFVDRPVRYAITVTNNGDGVARNTALKLTPSAGAELIDVGKGKATRSEVVWTLGTIAPNESREVSVTMKSSAPGMIRNTAVATADCAEGSGKAMTVVEGIPAILLECVDLEDPIEIGGKETYVITVTNQGSAVGTNISILCTLPAEQQFVSAEGPTKESVEGKQVTFAPLPSLAPKKTAVYKVNVQGTEAGDVRFKVSLTSDQMTTPAEETESTHIYK